MAKAYSKKELANLYGVSKETFRKWLRMVPGVNSDRYAVILPPADVERIFLHLGKPDSLEAENG